MADTGHASSITDVGSCTGTDYYWHHSEVEMAEQWTVHQPTVNMRWV